MANRFDPASYFGVPSGGSQASPLSSPPPSSSSSTTTTPTPTTTTTTKQHLLRHNTTGSLSGGPPPSSPPISFPSRSVVHQGPPGGHGGYLGGPGHLGGSGGQFQQYSSASQHHQSVEDLTASMTSNSSSTVSTPSSLATRTVSPPSGGSSLIGGGGVPTSSSSSSATTSSTTALGLSASAPSTASSSLLLSPTPSAPSVPSYNMGWTPSSAPPVGPLSNPSSPAPDAQAQQPSGPPPSQSFLSVATKANQRETQEQPSISSPTNTTSSLEANAKQGGQTGGSPSTTTTSSSSSSSSKADASFPPLGSSMGSHSSLHAQGQSRHPAASNPLPVRSLAAHRSPSMPTLSSPSLATGTSAGSGSPSLSSSFSSALGLLGPAPGSSPQRGGVPSATDPTPSAVPSRLKGHERSSSDSDVLRSIMSHSPLFVEGRDPSVDPPPSYNFELPNESADHGESPLLKRLSISSSSSSPLAQAVAAAAGTSFSPASSGMHSHHRRHSLHSPLTSGMSSSPSSSSLHPSAIAPGSPLPGKGKSLHVRTGSLGGGHPASRAQPISSSPSGGVLESPLTHLPPGVRPSRSNSMTSLPSFAWREETILGSTPSSSPHPNGQGNGQGHWGHRDSENPQSSPLGFTSGSLNSTPPGPAMLQSYNHGPGGPSSAPPVRRPHYVQPGYSPAAGQPMASPQPMSPPPGSVLSSASSGGGSVTSPMQVWTSNGAGAGLDVGHESVFPRDISESTFTDQETMAARQVALGSVAALMISPANSRPVSPGNDDENSGALANASTLPTAPVLPQKTPEGLSFWEVEFKAGRRESFTAGRDVSVAYGDFVIVEADRGKDLGKVVAALSVDTPENTPDVTTRNILRQAYPAEIDQTPQKLDEENKALLVCQSKVKQRKLPMEVVDAEYQFDHRKLTFYFTADHRIDFRELVRDLFKIYKTRIWLKQIILREGASGPVRELVPPRGQTTPSSARTPTTAGSPGPMSPVSSIAGKFGGMAVQPSPGSGGGAEPSTTSAADYFSPPP